MAFDVSTADIETRWRALSDDEADVGLARLVDAERKLRTDRPGLLAAWTALPAGTAKNDVLEAVREACANAVIRFLRNPDMNNRQDIGADGSIGIGFDTLTEGGVYISDADLAAIDAALAVATGTVRPRVRSQKLVSSWPWRDETVVTIFPTDSPAARGGLMSFQIGNL